MASGTQGTNGTQRNETRREDSGRPVTNGSAGATATDTGTGTDTGAGTGDIGAGAGTDVSAVTSTDADAVAVAKAAAPASGETVRVDSWIWSVRLVKTRSMGATACRGGHVRVNGERVKPAYAVRVGDEVRLRHAERERVVVVKRVIRKRVGVTVAAECYVDNSPPPPPREAVAPAGIRDRGTGRPTKRDRRELERLRGLNSPDSGPKSP
ncbi:ribosome-associated heat shock protein Hsp15 [Streptomyces aurantiacus]|uniref:RNA-binding S4 domain-containing protein n=1 Tax=Streptomyces aurantiacus TaxID=47760 RepID=UPI0027910A36|nr:RNA-binding S4 domain-containing protein [Streptomyces aurantiacus]MDQ0777977.1 ribosome-associated heat shock protein Hsp15 [Streptomyces aurantiacus]